MHRVQKFSVLLPGEGLQVDLAELQVLCEQATNLCLVASKYVTKSIVCKQKLNKPTPLE